MTWTAKALRNSGAIFSLFIGAAAQAQEACTTYVIVPGDHLRSIARKAYGDPDLYRLIFEANRATIGEHADLIRSGMSLVIPCKPGETAATEGATSVPLTAEVIDPAKEPLVILPEIPVEGASTGTSVAEEAPVPEEATPEATASVEPAPETAEVAEAAASEPAPEAENAAVAEAEPAAPEPVVTETAATVAGAAVDARPIRIVTGNGYSPFADEMLAGGGMFTQIVEMAIFRADPDMPYSLTFINDWQAHIDALLPDLAYDLSFPWIKPACETPEVLSAGDLARCNDFVFSAPYYEVVDGFFAASDSPLLDAAAYSDFQGKRICRPEAYTTGVLEAHGLGPDQVTMSRPLESSDCFEALAAGEVDLVSIDTAVGDAMLAEMGLDQKFRQNPNLTEVLTLHVIAHKSNDRAVQMLKVLDKGAMEMNQSGEWWDIVSDALDKQ